MLHKILDIIRSNNNNFFKFELIVYLIDMLNKLENNHFKELIDRIDLFSKGWLDKKKINKLIKNIFN